MNNYLTPNLRSALVAQVRTNCMRKLAAGEPSLPTPDADFNKGTLTLGLMPGGPNTTNAPFSPDNRTPFGMGVDGFLNFLGKQFKGTRVERWAKELNDSATAGNRIARTADEVGANFNDGLAAAQKKFDASIDGVVNKANETMGKVQTVVQGAGKDFNAGVGRVTDAVEGAGKDFNAGVGRVTDAVEGTAEGWKPGAVGTQLLDTLKSKFTEYQTPLLGGGLLLGALLLGKGMFGGGGGKRRRYDHYGYDQPMLPPPYGYPTPPQPMVPRAFDKPR